MASGDQQKLRQIVEQVVVRAGYDLEDLNVVAAGRRRQLRVVIDRDGGVDLDDAAALSRELSEHLDGSAADQQGDPMGAAPYTLEVTSPGVGRPLTLPRHFRRSAGRLLAVQLTSGESVHGRVRHVDQDRVELLVGSSGTQSRWVDFTAIDRARVEVEFSRPSAAVLALLGSAAPPEMLTDDADLLDEIAPADEADDDDDDEQDADEGTDEHADDDQDEPAEDELDESEPGDVERLTSKKEDRPS